ncbi:hypothetical protein AB6F64_14160 [Providencia hangzhouensis]|nr:MULTISPECIES: hypothetical protein [Providencia]MBJ9970363.1 hypothetical protein [Providencia rettgeri]MCB6145096.1 hypothetical protein [Providencia rettgeri]MCF8961961.1 hypothetical protein [Providencia rettgeri]MDB9565130.1 hypothetical protein [Providencia rettgeri]QWQ15799.1 hypothetical protein KOL65_13500 [Providencia rettgeri]
MKKIQFDIPFDQDKLLTYFNKKENNALRKKLTQVRNTSNASNGICHGLSNLYLLNENKSDGDKLIESMGAALKSIKAQSYHLKNRKPNDVEVSLLNKQIVNGLNIQISYERAYDFNKIAHKIDSLLIDNKKKKTSLINKSTDIKVDKNLISLDNKENDLNIKNLYDITHLLMKNISRVNKNVSYLDSKYEIIELVTFYYNLVRKNKEDSIEIYYCHKILNENIKNKIISDLPLDDKEIKIFLANAFEFISKLEMYKNTAKNINSGLINDISLPICDYANLQINKNQSNIEKLKADIENKLKYNNDYYSLISYDGHCMAISIKHDKNNYIYKFFDPNRGIKKYDNENDFLENLKHLLSYHSDKPIPNHIDEFKFRVLSMDSFLLKH